MNLFPSDFSQQNDATSLSTPGFDILLALSNARQAALPTVRMLRDRATLDVRAARLGTACEILGGTKGAAGPDAARPVRFLDLSDGGNAPSETVNDAFTRGFQPMLSPWKLGLETPASLARHDEDFME